MVTQQPPSSPENSSFDLREFLERFFSQFPLEELDEFADSLPISIIHE